MLKLRQHEPEAAHLVTRAFFKWIEERHAQLDRETRLLWRLARDLAPIVSDAYDRETKSDAEEEFRGACADYAIKCFELEVFETCVIIARNNEIEGRIEGVAMRLLWEWYRAEQYTKEQESA